MLRLHHILQKFWKDIPTVDSVPDLFNEYIKRLTALNIHAGKLGDLIQFIKKDSGTVSSGGGVREDFLEVSTPFTARFGLSK